MLAAGSAVALVGLQRRADLNDCEGHVLDLSKGDGRVPVRVQAPNGLEDVLVRMHNLVLVDSAAAKVLGDGDLLQQILSHVPAWEVAARASGVSCSWRSIVHTTPQFWSSLVVVAASEKKPNAAIMRSATSRLPGHPDRTVTRHMHCGAVPLHPAELRRVPNLGWVHTLIVPGAVETVEDLPPMETVEKASPMTDCFAQAADVAAVCAYRFPSLRTLHFNLNKHGERDSLLEDLKTNGPSCYAALASFMAALPASLRCLDLPLLDEIYTGSWRSNNIWSLWDEIPRARLTRLRALNPLVVWKGPRLAPDSELGEVPYALDSKFPPALCRSLEAVVSGELPLRDGDGARVLARLPNLRRARFEISGATRHTLSELCEALKDHGKVEALYLLLSECESSTWGSVYAARGADSPWRCFGPLSEQLRELAVIGIDSEFTKGPVASVARKVLKELLPRTAVVIASHGTLSFDEHARDLEALPCPLARWILPGVLESWQLHETAGREPFLNSTDPQVLARLGRDRESQRQLEALGPL